MPSHLYRGSAYDPSKVKKAHRETLDRVSGFTYRGKSYHYESKHKAPEDTGLSV